jgi:hypothetical protein
LVRPAATLLSSIALLSVSALSAAQTLIQAQIGEQHSQTVYAMSLGSYELENGEIQSMREFYSTPWRDVRLVALSQVLPNVGVIWGASTGERGDKYTIHPSLTLGVTGAHSFSDQSSISLSWQGNLGGSLIERPCTATFTLGGTQDVNCRLAASTLPPAETLELLLDEPVPERWRSSVTFQHRFWPERTHAKR